MGHLVVIKNLKMSRCQLNKRVYQNKMGFKKTKVYFLLYKPATPPLQDSWLWVAGWLTLGKKSLLTFCTSWWDDKGKRKNEIIPTFLYFSFCPQKMIKKLQINCSNFTRLMAKKRG